MLDNIVWDRMLNSVNETLYMSFFSVIVIFILGLTVGLSLYLTDEDRLIENKGIYRLLSITVDLLRSIPFIILLILLVPFTKLIMGTMLGKTAALPALIIGGTPFYARMVEISLREVDKGTIEASQSMGASLIQIIRKVLIKESLPGIISGITVTAISIVSYSAMAGVIGAGGLGNYAYLYGFQRNNQQVVVVSTVFILLIVLVIQKVGDYYTQKIDHRK
ncbi:methionine ABC transporter permease [Mycoplasmatota bacterium zrk1]